MSGFIDDLPKAELHLHIEGTMEPSQVMSFAARNGLDFPYKTADELLATYEFADLTSFIKAFQLNASTLVTDRDFYELTYAYMRRVHADNVRHVEIAVAPQGVSHRGLPMPVAMEGILAALDDAGQAFGITGGLIVGCQRHRGPEDCMKMLRDLRPYRDSVTALGLAGIEVGFPPMLFERLFDEARDLGWKTTAHAGEEGPADYVRQAIEILKVDRIDHGVRSAEDPDLVRLLAERQIPLTVCPLSNVYLKIFPSLRQHNLARLLRAGVLVSINSDDPPYFGGYLNENFRQSTEALGLSKDEIVVLAKNGFLGSFAAGDVRRKGIAEIDRVAALHEH